MYKIYNAIERAKENRWNVVSRVFNVYRFKGEKKLRIDNKEESLSSYRREIYTPLVKMVLKDNEWIVAETTPEGEYMVYMECFNEALTKLYYGPFVPELDNLEEKKVDDIRFKVGFEGDLAIEGSIGDLSGESVSDVSLRVYARKAKAFEDKWRPFKEIKLPGEEMDQNGEMLNNR